METKSKEKQIRKYPQPKIAAIPLIKKPITKDPVVNPIKPREAIILLRDLLGNFSDQTGASFG